MFLSYISIFNELVTFPKKCSFPLRQVVKYSLISNLSPQGFKNCGSLQESIQHKSNKNCDYEKMSLKFYQWTDSQETDFAVCQMEQFVKVTQLPWIREREIVFCGIHKKSRLFIQKFYLYWALISWIAVRLFLSVGCPDDYVVFFSPELWVTNWQSNSFHTHVFCFYVLSYLRKLSFQLIWGETGFLLHRQQKD